MVSLWVQYLAKGPRPDFNNGPLNNSNSGRISVPSVHWSLIRIMAPLQAIPILECWRRLPQLALSPPFWFPAKCYEASFKRAQNVNKNCLTTPHLLCCTHRLTRFHLSSQQEIHLCPCFWLLWLLYFRNFVQILFQRSISF